MKIKNEDLKKIENPELTLDESLQSNYRNWMNYRKTAKKNFMMIPKEFIESKYIQAINSNAVSLYLYYIYRAKNETGISWPSISRIAEDLNVSEKSINNWNATLENIGLIHRESGFLSKTTYLLPISNYLTLEKRTTFKNFVETSKKAIDGELVAAFHLFQWRKGQNTEKYDSPYNVICLVFRRTYNNPLKIGKEKFRVDKIVFFEEGIKRVTFKEEQFKEKVATFESPEKDALNSHNIKIKGLIINSAINLKDFNDDLLESIESLTDLFTSSEDTDGVFNELKQFGHILL